MSTTAQQIAFTLSGNRAQRLGGGGWLVACPVPSHGKGRGDRSPSLSIRDGDRCLLVRCFAGCDVPDVLDELRRRGLLDDRMACPDRKPAASKVPAAGSDDYERRQCEKARWLWTQRKPIVGSIAEIYLREARGISCPLPPTLAFLPPRKPTHHPAMIAAFGLPQEIAPGVLSAPCDVVAVHLTLLKPDGSSKAEMPEDRSSKIVVGRAVQALLDDDDARSLPIVVAPFTDMLGLVITEGIEDALSVHEAMRRVGGGNGQSHAEA
jgi:putative DNA primase/helicase